MKSIIFLLVLFLLSFNLYSEEIREALVIGNANYQNGYPLANPGNDARDMASILRLSGFNVNEYFDLDQVTMKMVIDKFGARLNSADVGLFFYAGHGIQANGNNYLIPVDASLNTENDIEYNCVHAGRVLSKMEDAATGTNIIILDACRDNPFERSWSRKSNGLGLSFMSAPGGSFIAYSTSPGKTASDGNTRNSPYTSAMIRFMAIPNIKIEDVFKLVRTEVRKSTHGLQIPWESTSLERDFYFSLEQNSSHSYTEQNELNSKVESNETFESTENEEFANPQDYESHRKRLAREIRSIAILPFANYTGDENLEYMAAGLHDALISELGQIGTIRVISKTTTLPYADFQKTMQEISGELNVNGIVEASLLSLDENIRIQLKLFSSFPEEQLIWSQVYDVKLNNIYELYGQILKNIAFQIQLALSQDQKSKYIKTDLVNPDAYKAYLEGKFHSEKLSPEGFRLALEYVCH